MIIGTSTITQNIDKACDEKLGIPLIVLMENAVLSAIKNMDIDKYEKYTVVCGTGNNGGDGLGIARHLSVQGKIVNIFVLGDINKLSKCSKINYNILINMDENVKIIKKADDLEGFEERIRNSDIIVDAVFGTGLKREVCGVFKEAINIINKNSKCTYSIDVPSGIDSDTGQILGTCIKAKKTICFEFYKRGFLNYDISEFIGDVIVESIGVPLKIKDKYHNREFITDKKFVQRSIRVRDKHGFKSDFGKVSIIAGSTGFYGASYIATESAVKSGSGLVTLISSKDVQEKVAVRLTEAMTSNFDDIEKLKNLLNKSDAIGFGPGMGNNDETFRVLLNTIEKSNCPIVLDADGLNVLKNNTSKFLEWNRDFIITPHLGEMASLTGESIEYIRKNRVDVAKKFAEKHNMVVILKGYQTVITDGYTTYINPTGNSSMANGGMGDCLLGIVTSFVGQGMSLLEAAVSGVYLHGYIGDKLAEELYTVNAQDIIGQIQYIMRELKNSK